MNATTAAKAQDPSHPTPDRRREFLGIGFDPLDQRAALAWLRSRNARDDFAYVVTPNVDHVVRLYGDESGQAASYGAARLCLCDSRVLAALARWCGIALPVVPGSDLVAALFQDVFRPGDVVSLIGGSPADMTLLARRFPHIILRQHVPPMGLRTDSTARGAAVQAAMAHEARFILLAVGSPQQEMIALELSRTPGARGTALCIGASVDFLTGAQRRAPRFIQYGHLEWAWRLASDPKRMWRRYIVDGPAVFRLAWRWKRETESPAEDRLPHVSDH